MIYFISLILAILWHLYYKYLRYFIFILKIKIMITKTMNISKGIQIKWTKIYTLMHRIQMKLESFLNQTYN